jgi:hypothetical protein
MGFLGLAWALNNRPALRSSAGRHSDRFDRTGIACTHSTQIPLASVPGLQVASGLGRTGDRPRAGPVRADPGWVSRNCVRGRGNPEAGSQGPGVKRRKTAKGLLRARCSARSGRDHRRPGRGGTEQTRAGRTVSSRVSVPGPGSPRRPLSAYSRGSSSPASLRDGADGLSEGRTMRQTVRGSSPPSPECPDSRWSTIHRCH